MSDTTFDFNVFIKDSKESIMNPKEYFSTMRTEGGLVEPIIKALIYGLISAVITFIWSLLKIGSSVGLLGGGAIGFGLFIWTFFTAVIGVFIGGVIILIFSAICSGKTEFEPNLRVAASLLVLMPIGAFLGFAGSVHYILGLIVYVAVQLYGLWMLYNALTQTLGGKETVAKIIGFIFAGIFVLILLFGLAANRAVKKIDRWGTEYVKEWEDAGKEWEKAAKEMEKQAKKLEKEMLKALEEAEEAAEEDIE